MTNKFYIEEDEDDGGWVVIQESGGYELGAYFDTAEFWCCTEEDAIAAATLLNTLYEKAKKEANN